MKGFILAAGMGTRLKPWTDFHPKAMVPVGGIPMIERVVNKMQLAGITDITVNVYHFAQQIIDFVKDKGWNINISDERPTLLETGGALLHAAKFLNGDEPILIHNADILSNADFIAMKDAHIQQGNDITLLVSDRDSSRKLVFDTEGELKGWHSRSGGEFKPRSFIMQPDYSELAFSGIYIISPGIFTKIRNEGFSGKFSIIDFFLESIGKLKIKAFQMPDLYISDIGKPESLARAEKDFNIS